MLHATKRVVYNSWRHEKFHSLTLNKPIATEYGDLHDSTSSCSNDFHFAMSGTSLRNADRCLSRCAFRPTFRLSSAPENSSVGPSSNRGLTEESTNEHLDDTRSSSVSCVAGWLYGLSRSRWANSLAVGFRHNFVDLPLCHGPARRVTGRISAS